MLGMGARTAIRVLGISAYDFSAYDLGFWVLIPVLFFKYIAQVQES